MFHYFASFPAGTYNIIVKRLKRFNPQEVQLLEHDDSSVLLAASVTPEQLIELRFFTNVYAVVPEQGAVALVIRQNAGFRLFGLRHGQTIMVAPHRRAQIARQLEHIGLTSGGQEAQFDVYDIERASGVHLVGIRLPKAKAKRERLQAGELSVELAHILCLVAGLQAKQTLLDPFAGFGAIPLEAVRGFGCKQVTALDLIALPGRREHSEINWRIDDATAMEWLPESSIDRIVTDPPWGSYEAAPSEGLAALYAQFSREAERVLKPGGIMVMLSAYAGAPESWSTTRKLELVGSWPILVAGKKAVIYKLRKRT